MLQDKLLTPPPQGKALMYHQKQYQSVWLAVPPQEKQAARRAPLNRLDGGYYLGTLPSFDSVGLFAVGE
jgi:hypothetical protein